MRGFLLHDVVFGVFFVFSSDLFITQQQFHPLLMSSCCVDNQTFFMLPSGFIFLQNRTKILFDNSQSSSYFPDGVALLLKTDDDQFKVHLGLL